MKKRFILFLILFIMAFAHTSKASLMICNKGICRYMDEFATLRPYIKQIYCLFKTTDARIDFCEADPNTHTCMANNISWYADSPIMPVFFAVPVARTLPQKNTLLMDYLVKANESLTACNFSITSFEEADNHTIKIVSHPFSCDAMTLGKVQFQNTFFVDYIDYDNEVIGAKYTIQTHGAIKGNAAGYTLMRFRNGKTLLPLVVEPYYGELPEVPDAAQLGRLTRQLELGNPQPPEHPLIAGIKDWWGELKESLNLDHAKRPSVQEDDHWWTKFSRKALKVLYLEPTE